MRRALATLSTVLALAAPLAADRVVFANGDRLHGELAGIDDADHLLWKTSAAGEPARLPLPSVHRLIFDRETATPSAGGHDLALTLTNGNTLHGRLVAMGEEAIRIEAPAYGRLEIPRQMISGMNINDGGYFLLAEPGSAKEWFANNRGAWSVSNGELRAEDSGFIGRALPPGERIRIDFEYTSDDNGSGLAVHFFADNPEDPADTTNYTVQISGSYVYARKVVRHADNNGLFGRRIERRNEPLGDPKRLDRRAGATPTRVTILGDSRAGKVILRINGERVQEWNDPRGLGENPGSAIGFTNNSQANIVIRDLQVTRWNGSPEEPGREMPLEDTLHLRNNDTFTGSVTALEDGALTIDAEHFGEVRITTDRILRVNLGKREIEQARRMPGDVRLGLLAGGVVTLQLQELRDGVIHGFSENFGEASVDVSAVREIEFNLYAEKWPDPDQPVPGNLESLLDGEW